LAETTNAQRAGLERLKLDTAKRLAEYYRQEGKRLTAQQIVQRLENFRGTGDASRDKLREGARKYSKQQATRYKKEASKALVKSASMDAAKQKYVESVSRQAGKGAGKQLGKFAFGPIGYALAELADTRKVGIDEADVASYVRRHGVWPEDLPAHIDNDIVYAFLGNFTRADALRSMVGAEPLQPLRDASDAWGRARRYVNEQRDAVKTDPSKTQQQRLKEQRS